MINPTYTKSFWYFDDKLMLLENLGWSDGKGDSVGRNAFAYICYPNQSFLKESILQCIRQRDDSYIQFYRYPDYGADTISRDHVGAIIVALYVNRDWDELNWVLDNLPWRLSRKYTQTIDFWLWHKSLRNRWISYLFVLVTFVQAILFTIWNPTVRLILGIKKVDDLDNAKFVRFSGWRSMLFKTIYPHFALFLLVWQIRVIPKSWFKWLLQQFLLIESANIVIDATLGKPISDDQWKMYKPTTSFIWSRRLDTSDDVTLRYMIEDESLYNDLNRAMLDYLYFGIDKIMIDHPDEIVRSIKNKQEIINY